MEELINNGEDVANFSGTKHIHDRPLGRALVDDTYHGARTATLTTGRGKGLPGRADQNVKESRASEV